jgi:predicted HicB family RNase H-like nuclease
MPDPPAKRGRPPLDPQDHTVRVNLCLPATTYDRLYAAARQDAVSVPAYIRQTLNNRAKKSPAE